MRPAASSVAVSLKRLSRNKVLAKSMQLLIIPLPALIPVSIAGSIQAMKRQDAAMDGLS